MAEMWGLDRKHTLIGLIICTINIQESMTCPLLSAFHSFMVNCWALLPIKLEIVDQPKKSGRLSVAGCFA